MHKHSLRLRRTPNYGNHVAHTETVHKKWEAEPLCACRLCLWCQAAVNVELPYQRQRRPQCQLHTVLPSLTADAPPPATQTNHQSRAEDKGTAGAKAMGTKVTLFHCVYSLATKQVFPCVAFWRSTSATIMKLLVRQ
eukprot:TRINITY_DN1268_c0_g1_i9.p2 TRINITY_DN1268_c0_g1~~TRINITY_DN1268_c0_g1_i9.p2  ORF type:complete len:137 (+),score=21.30 TRINITY_DN1268_c0_g1_i9:358-768(+)